VLSGRRGGPFVPFNCSTLPRELFDSQLFGYRRGAFTGAVDGFEGILRSAAGGTLFLDEVADLPLDIQPKLLRFLDTGEVQGLGEKLARQADVRILAATNADLEQLVATGAFRADLYYRLNVFRLRIPPLRERRDDIHALIDHYLDNYSGSLSKTVRLSRAARVHLMLSDWPGNVRQLASELFRLVASVEDGEEITPELLTADSVHLSKSVTGDGNARSASSISVDLTLPLRVVVEQVERVAISRALEVSGGDLAATAGLLGLSRKGLYLKRQRLGL
jgi:transcriptional regulator with PAS, ATPase and Fis domain